MKALQDGGPNPHFEGLHHGETDELRTLRLKQAAENESLRATLKVAGEALDLGVSVLKGFPPGMARNDGISTLSAALQQIKEAQR